ncbi:DUF1572 family protein [Pseudalkalibacillus caeni]|uniref:DUF1572 domain-containing protein n=1 Tax=Exobacillus caeni TaxID=2574798 RepID=A0A5R9F9N3_9BACL|nr:DUF1572 family protein [Pseudalkalibacillus caeni]TLS37264.1 DUF1572 domain-containing protein [Pseudalkalibacillus caeni]
MRDPGTVYLKNSCEQFRHIKQRAEAAIEQLNEEEFHWVPNEQSNSVSVLLQHISGNMHSRWVDFLTADGEKDYRDRDAEFINQFCSKKELMERWESGWSLLFQTLEGLSPGLLLQEVTIRKERLTIMEAIQRELAHLHNHLGQILYIGKQLKGSEWKTLSIPKGQSRSFIPAAIKNKAGEEQSDSTS